MLWGLMVVLLVLWLLGFLVVPIAGGLIHLLLVIALVVLIYQLVTGRRSLQGTIGPSLQPLFHRALSGAFVCR